MNTAAPNPATEKTEEEKKDGVLMPLLLLLLFLLLATSCIVGFLLGRTTDPGRFGALIDTIVLDPTAVPGSDSPGEGGSAGTLPGQISILGVVHYTDGTPFTQGSVELHSEPRYSQVNSQGQFRFDQVELGEHELTVLDREGNPLAGRTIRVTRDAVGDSYIDYEEMVCVLHVKVLTVEVDVELTLERTPGGLLEINLAGSHEEDVPGFQAGVPSAQDPDALPGVPITTAPAAMPEGAPAAPPAVTSGGASTSPPAAAHGPQPGSQPDTPSGRDPSPTPDDPGTVEAHRSDDRESWQAWTQEAEIDLFRPLDGSDQRIIAPGSEGYYLFRLKNGRSGTIQFTMALKEGNFHIPLEYRLAADKAGSAGLTQWKTASTDKETVSDAVRLEAGQEKCCRIEWRWPFEGSDKEDTALGLRADRIYTLKLTIRVEDAV